MPILKRLHEGQIVALISDAGTPGISDPGMELVSFHLKNSVINFSCSGMNKVPLGHNWKLQIYNNPMTREICVCCLLI